MDATLSGRSFKYLALPLLILSIVTTGFNPLARARDPAATIRGPSVMTPATPPMCDTAEIAACRMTAKGQGSGNVTAPRRVSEPFVAQVRTQGNKQSPLIHIQLQLQKDLFTRGGRLAPIDALVAAAASGPTERTSKAPDWATQLRAARIENEKARSSWTLKPCSGSSGLKA